MLKIIGCAVLGLGFLWCGLVWLMTRIRYRITPRHFQVTLFGVRLRRIPLGEIRGVSKRRASGWSEKWHNTIRPSHRKLVVRRSRGLFRNVVITPRNRYVFKADLERAIEDHRDPDRGSKSRFLIVSD